MASSSNGLAVSFETKLDLSDSGSFLPSSLFLPRTSYFNQKNAAQIQQLLLRRNRLESLKAYEKALMQFKQHLIELSLRENSLGQFPHEVLMFDHLISLSLAHNALTCIDMGILPRLPHLQWLNLSHNQLETLPSDLVCCHQLRGLDLENNHIQTFPQVIFYLTRLEILMIQKNKIKSMPPHYRLPDSLSTLNLAFNMFTQVPSLLTDYPPCSITHLYLSGNPLGKLPSSFLSTGYTHLVSLDLHSCQLATLDNVICKRLSHCKDFRRFNLAINQLTEIPTEIGLLTQLQWLNLNDNQITHLPPTMIHLICLVKLGLVQNRIQSIPPFLFVYMSQLQKLDIRRNQIRHMPPSILALAPQHEVHEHIDLSVPHTIFCNQQHGSLRTLLLYENQAMEHVDGILYDLGECDTVQLMSLREAYRILQVARSSKDAEALLLKAFVSPKNPHTVHGLSEIDSHEEEEKERHHLVTQVSSLKELSLRSHLNRFCQTTQDISHRRDQDRHAFVDKALPESIVPDLIYASAYRSAKQCDLCHGWYTVSHFQIGYLARLCNNRLQVPIRFAMCSFHCAIQAMIKLHQASLDCQPMPPKPVSTGKYETIHSDALKKTIRRTYKNDQGQSDSIGIDIVK
ncbi:uncharacterized protein B0P05DRAFT_545666 [Gilbertella persicaria]|uniref:uncharacterized protein n=1 Tax=Gilbertella persicaria TaxID=101096 RepID=UPI00221FC46E|nr:uncharacterized protein B0P05DRAFT_545666 [Gilbertella persicaria]KAI8076385.1 hypothetical protein B0P05DRAFT_545666 [Gilbertella persicaria]